MTSIWAWLTNRWNFPIWNWISDHTALIWWMAVISGLMFLISLFLVPLLIVRLPKDYFLRERPPMADEFRQQRPIIRWLLLIGKNLLGAVLVLGGIAMLAGPGQGVLTLLIGLMLLNFPGKRQVEHWILLRPTVERLLNWIRRKHGREPLLFPKKARRSRDAISASQKQQT
jgi:hypothetical protein